MSEVSAQTKRFRREGRSGQGTYQRLFSEKYNVPPRRQNEEKKTVHEEKQVISKRRSLAQKSFISRKLAELTGKLRAKIPKPVKKACRKTDKLISALTEKIRSWKHLNTCIKGAVLCLAMGLCLLSMVYSIGCRALERGGVSDSLSRQYPAYSGFSPKGQAIISDADMQSGSVIAISSADIGSYLRKDEPQRVKTAIRAGINEMSVMGLNVNLYCIAEAGTGYISPFAFGKNGNRDIEYVIPPTRAQLCTVGCHTLRVRTGGRECNVLLIVEDTRVPSVSFRDVEIMLGDTVTADRFIESSADPSPVVVSFLNKAPDCDLSGQQLVYLNIMDTSGNACELLAARLTVMADVEPPVISGAEDRTVVIGETVAYKEGITVTDDLDDDITLKVDTSKVDPNTEGYYEVIYTAADSSGNAASVTVTFHFTSQDNINTDAEFDRYVKRISGNIIRDSMTDTQKLWAIYEWCRNSISYSGHSDKDDWKKAAVTGFRKRSGDCFTYFACAKALMEYNGIENIDVIKIKDTTDQSSHFWSLVDIGTGYYHFDATPRIGGFDGFMLTDRQLQDYSLANKNSHRYHTNLYPATPAEKFVSPDASAEEDQ